MPNLGRREPYPPIGPAHDPLSLYRQMMDFLMWLEERNTSRHTLKHWELYLRYFVSWCAGLDAAGGDYEADPRALSTAPVPEA